ncbi:Imm21 family immunity protein [Streptomyces achromogenes]|uniref:Imm21 family immunity protein n=1 Tax=Streptomyces achromogenes TaxID=67255 RepID=UPI0033E4B868
MGGPLIVVPESSVNAWGECTEDGSVLGDADGRDDYDRACEVEGWAGAIAVGAGAVTALVLADEPSRTCFLPENLLLVRWLAAGSEAELFAAVEAVLADPDTAWEHGGLWGNDGPAVVMDSAVAGPDLGVEYPDEAGRTRLQCRSRQASGGCGRSIRTASSHGSAWCGSSPRTVTPDARCPCHSDCGSCRCPQRQPAQRPAARAEGRGRDGARRGWRVGAADRTSRARPARAASGHASQDARSRLAGRGSAGRWCRTRGRRAARDRAGTGAGPEHHRMAGLWQGRGGRPVRATCEGHGRSLVRFDPDRSRRRAPTGRRASRLSPWRCPQPAIPALDRAVAPGSLLGPPFPACCPVGAVSPLPPSACPVVIPRSSRLATPVPSRARVAPPPGSGPACPPLGRCATPPVGHQAAAVKLVPLPGRSRGRARAACAVLVACRLAALRCASA